MVNRLTAAITIVTAFSGCTPAQDDAHVNEGVNGAVSSALVSDKLWQDPAVACSYLASQGLATNPYQDYGGEAWCMASVFSAETAPVPNEISYTASGSGSQVQKLELAAEMYNYTSAEDRRTLDAAGALAEHLLRVAVGDSFPSEALRAFRTGESGSWDYAGATIEVVRNDHLPGRGFTMTLRIK